MAGEYQRISGPEGEFSAYLATPESGRGPGLLLIQEMFGVNAFMRHACEFFAEAGYFALCPDLYWRQRPDVDLSDASEEEMNQAFALLEGFGLDTGVEDLETAMSHLSGLAGCTARIGAAGYCLGGLLAYLLMCRTGADCAVGYYGVNIQERLDEAGQISKPLMLHVAEEDRTMSGAAIAALKAGLADHPQVTIHSYPGLDHGFARVGTRYFDYNGDAADLANGRTLAFLARHLN